MTGTITAANVLGFPAAQGVASGDFASLVRAIASEHGSRREKNKG
jgi:hypothetical protein